MTNIYPPVEGIEIPGLPGHSIDPDADTAPAPRVVELTERTIVALHELLGMCEEFLRIAGPTTHAELRDYLDLQNPPADPFWLIDMLGFNQLHLGHKLSTTSDRPSQTWQEAPQ